MRTARPERATHPTPGWKARTDHVTPTALVNPRTPAVPATLDLRLEEYFASAALIGILAAQDEEPDKEWASEWAMEQGRIMAAKAREQRKARSR